MSTPVDTFGGLDDPGLSVLMEMQALGADPRDLSAQQLNDMRTLFARDDGLGLYCFTYFICGAHDLYFPLHFSMCQVLSQWGYLYFADGTRANRPMQEGDNIIDNWRRIHLCVPRDHFKTTVGTRATALWNITHNTELTIGIWNENGDKSKSWVGATKKVVEESKLYHLLWPHVLPRGIHFQERERGISSKRNHKWGDTGLLFVRDSHMVAELSIEPFGIGGASAGKHFTHVIKDDIIGDKAAESESVMNDSIDWVNTARALERPAENGCELVNYTRWGYYDVYKHMLTKWKGQYKVYLRHMLEDSNGNPDVVNGNVIFPTRFTTAQAREMYEQDPFVFMCLPDEAPITMSDFTERPISSLKVGDELLGYDDNKSNLTTCRVEHIASELGEVWEYELDDGTVVRSTPNHNWGVIHRNKAAYKPVKVGSIMRQVYERRTPEGHGGWLGGFYDGDGSLCGNALHFIQSTEAHDVCERMFDELHEAGFPYTKTIIDRQNEAWTKTYDVWLTGGRSVKIQFLQHCTPSKVQPILNSLYHYGGRLDRRKVVRAECIGTQRVWKMQTTTQNYTAYGMLSSNSQYMCIPMSGRTTSFQFDWFRNGSITFDSQDEPNFLISPESYDPHIMHSDLHTIEPSAPQEVPLHMMSKAIIIDPAPSRRSDKRQEPRARNGLVVVGKDPWGRNYALEGLALREDPVEVMYSLVALMKKWRTTRVAIEEVVFSAVYAPLWQKIMYHEYPDIFPEWIAVAPKGRDKDQRIFTLAGPMKQGFWYFNTADTGYITQELLEFPNGETKDLIDAMSYTEEVVSRNFTPEEELASELSLYSQDQGRSAITGY